jgi:hypothetical protein
MRRRGRAWASLVAIGLAACASGGRAPSGFLGDYAGFEPAADGSGALSYRRSNVDWSRYERVMIDPVHVALRAESASTIDPAQLAALARYFHDALIVAFKKRYPVADEPAADVLRLRVALTDVVPTQPAMSTVATLAIPVRAASAAHRAIEGTDLFVGEVSIEAEAIDSVTGARLVGLVDRKAGDRFHVSDDRTTWGHVTRAFREWAARFRLRLDAARAENEAPDGS